MKNIKERLLKHKNTINIIITILFIIAIIRVSYAFFSFNKITDTELIYNGYGKIDMILNNLASGITLNDQFPMTDEEGIANATSYTFTISGYSEIEVKQLNYTIKALPGAQQQGKVLFDDLAIKLYLTDDQENVIYGPDYAHSFNSGGTLLHTDYFSGGTESNKIVRNYILKVWISDKVAISNQNIEGKIAYSQEDYANRYISLKIKVEGYTANPPPRYELLKDVLLAPSNIKGTVSYGDPGEIFGGLYYWHEMNKYIYRGGITKINPNGLETRDYLLDEDDGDDIDNYVKVSWETYGEDETCEDKENNKCWRIVSVNADDAITIIRDRNRYENKEFDMIHNSAASAHYEDDETDYGYNDLLANPPTPGHPEEYRPYSLMYILLYGENGYQNTELSNYFHMLQTIDVCLNKVDDYRGINYSTYSSSSGVKDTCNVIGKPYTLEVPPLQNQYVRLLYMEEYINASLEKTCLGDYDYSCRNKNYLYNKTYSWALNGYYTESWFLRYFSNRGTASSNDANGEYGVRPVVVLKSTTLISGGTGSAANPYNIQS